MKKLTTIVAALCMVLGINAQSLGVSVNGNAMKDGQYIEIIQDNALSEELIPGVLSVWGFAPEIIVSNTEGGEVTVKVEDLNKTENMVQNCFTQCITCNSKNDYTVGQTKVLKGSEDAKIHVELGTAPDCPVAAPYSHNVQVTASTANDSISIKVILTYDPVRAASEKSPIIGGGSVDPDPQKPIKGDVNHDGKVTIDDITRLIEIYLSKES